MEKIFDKNSLMQSSIFELRDIARTIGVYSPTIYKKEELIDKMFKIINGEEQPYVPKSRQGRPPKNLSGKTKMLETFLPSNTEEKTFDLENGNAIGVLSESIIAFLEDSNVPVLRTEVFTGYLDILESVGYGIIRPLKDSYNASKTVYVSVGQIENYNLKTGDLLTVEARMLHKEKPLVLTLIKNINGREYKNPVRNENFENLAIEFPVKELKFGEDINRIEEVKDLKLLPIVCGTRNLILISKEKKYNTAGLIRGLNSLVGGKMVYLGLELLPEYIPLMQNINGCETLYCSLGEDNLKQARIVILALNRAKRLVEEKNDVLLFVDSLDKIIKNENFVNDNNINDINKKTLVTAKSMLASARSVSVGGSLTEVIVMNYKENSAFDETIIGELENLFNNIIRI